MIAEIFFEIDAHLSFHDSQATANDALVVDLLDHESKIKVSMRIERGYQFNGPAYPIFSNNSRKSS